MPLATASTHTKPFLSLHTLPPFGVNPKGGYMCTSSNRSPWRKTFFTSNCLKGLSRLTAREYDFDGVHFGHMSKGLLIDNSISLGVSLGNQSSFVSINYPIWLVLYLKHPHTSHCLFFLRELNHLPSRVLLESIHFFYHKRLPLRIFKGFLKMTRNRHRG